MRIVAFCPWGMNVLSVGEEGERGGHRFSNADWDRFFLGEPI